MFIGKPYDVSRAIKPKGVAASDFVFPGSSKAGHLVGLPKMWERAAKRAKLKGVTLHGLRHWFASAATELGYSDLIIGALLGHAKKGITGRYATAPDPALVAAADRISLALAKGLDGTAGADNVVRDGRLGAFPESRRRLCDEFCNLPSDCFGDLENSGWRSPRQNARAEKHAAKD